MRMGSVLGAVLEIARERLAIRVERLEAVEEDAPPLLSVPPIVGAGARPCAFVLGGT